MATNTVDRVVIEFIRDDTDNDPGEQRINRILDIGVRTSKPVGVSDGKSIEFFLVETVDRLDVVREATAGG